MWTIEAVAISRCSLHRCLEEGRGAVIFIVGFHSDAVHLDLTTSPC